MLRSPLLHFLIAGAAILVVQRIGAFVVESSQAPVVEVRRSEIDARIDAYQRQMGRLADAEEAEAIEARVVDDALWLEQAWALGLQETDPVVRQRLLLNMRFLDVAEGLAEDELVARAIELGMDRSDTVVQRRLIDRVQAMIRAGVRAQAPDEALLREHYSRTLERWREPPQLDLTHVYFSRDKRGDRGEGDAIRLLATLREAGTGPADAVAQGDAFLSGHRIRAATPNRIVARLGPDFANGIAEAPVRRWVGPVPSAFGTHLVWIHERVESRTPAFEEIRDRVRDDWVEAESRSALRRQLERRREIVEVRIIDDRTRSGDRAAREGDV